MKKIKLTQGKVALVDDEDFEYLNQWKWSANKNKNTFYAQRHKVIEGKNKYIKMHRLIMNTPDNIEVDHIDHNGLNCQRHNMRNCTRSQNSMNKSPYGKSKYLGVYFIGKTIIAGITINKKLIYLGSYKSEEDAALAYDIAAKKYHGEFANFNLNQ